MAVPDPAEVTAFKNYLKSQARSAMETVYGMPETLPEGYTEDDIKDQWEQFGEALGEILAYKILNYFCNPPGCV